MLLGIFYPALLEGQIKPESGLLSNPYDIHFILVA
jgi:hypothetical protein